MGLQLGQVVANFIIIKLFFFLLNIVKIRRDPKYMVKPSKKPWHENKENQISTRSLSDGASIEPIDPEIIKKTPKARRNIILIRHGQYETHAKESKNKILTALGNINKHYS